MERKTEENYIKTGEKALKNSPYWVINSKLSRGSSNRWAGLAPPAI